MPSRSWTKVPVFCSGEKHEIWWDEVGRLRLPHHTSIDTAAIEAKLMKSKQLPDELCYVFASAMRGSELCTKVLLQAAELLSPELKQRIMRIETKRAWRDRNRRDAINPIKGLPEKRHPEILSRCETLFKETTLGIDTKEDIELRGHELSERVVHVGSTMGKPSFLVRATRLQGASPSTPRHVLMLWISIDPKAWAGLFLKGKVLLEDPETSHPSKRAFALAPGPDPVSLYCIRYKRASYDTSELPHTLELGLERVRFTENGWAICARRVYL